MLLDKESLRKRGYNYDDILSQIEEGLNRQVFGFEKVGEGLYLIDDEDNDYNSPVYIVIRIQEIQDEHPWFKEVLKSIELVTVDEVSNLMPALDV